MAASPKQSSEQVPREGSAPASLVTFTLDFPGSEPTHYSIAVDANGHATYECTVKVEGSEEQTYRWEFEVTRANRDRIFEWTKEAKYFSGKIDSGNHKLAFTGEKVLSYQDGQRSETARYNYSNLESVRQLTSLFQSMAGTLDYGRRLTYYHRYQKLALDDELKRMETQAKDNELSEIQGVAPVLQGIVEDSSVINVVRALAKALIQMGSGGAAGR
ncbi:MAG: hypothetical protein WAN63_17610 [Candidatus Sulfotelmatobacter sp.]